MALETRPAIVGVILATIALTPWQHNGPTRVIVSLDEIKRPPVIVSMELDAGPGLLDQLVPNLGALLDPSVVMPPAHPDAAPWPRGMVIHPGHFPDNIAIGVPGILDRLLSGLSLGLLGPSGSVES